MHPKIGNRIICWKAKIRKRIIMVQINNFMIYECILKLHVKSSIFRKQKERKIKKPEI
jgi:hypothetical protein